MKKIALSLAVATALAAPFAAQADTILYGEARLSVDYIDNHVQDLDSYWDVIDDGSKLGVKGTEDLGGGLSAFSENFKKHAIGPLKKIQTKTAGGLAPAGIVQSFGITQRTRLE